jgi:hypothetical protein
MKTYRNVETDFPQLFTDKDFHSSIITGYVILGVAIFVVKEVIVWYSPVTPTLGSLGQEDREFETSLGYKVRPCLKKQKNTT